MKIGDVCCLIGGAKRLSNPHKDLVHGVITAEGPDFGVEFLMRPLSLEPNRWGTGEIVGLCTGDRRWIVRAGVGL